MTRRFLLLAPLLLLLSSLVVALVAVDSGKGSSPRGVVAPAPTALVRGGTTAGLRAAIIGDARVGTFLVAAVRGPRTKVPRTLRFQWQVCDWTGGGCNDVAGARRQRFRVGAPHLGRILRVTITIVAPTPVRTLPSVAVGPIAGQSDPVIAAAGDIACDPASSRFAGGVGSDKNCRQKWTSDLLAGMGLSAVLPLGDLQYECGNPDAFGASYDPSWGRLKQITHPAIGNHEYGKSCQRNDATAYFTYFGALANPARTGAGWYSYNIGSWHLIALNSECSYGTATGKVGGCSQGSPQESWLRQDLAAHPNACTLAYWHEPRFSSGEHGNSPAMVTVWNDLVAAHADVVLSGHNHDYERFDPLGTTPASSAGSSGAKASGPDYQNPALDPNGIREFIVGTGGKNHYGFGAQPPLAGEVVRDSSTYGVLKLTLHANSYDWQFVNDPGSGTFTDAGSGTCH